MSIYTFTGVICQYMICVHLHLTLLMGHRFSENCSFKRFKDGYRHYCVNVTHQCLHFALISPQTVSGQLFKSAKKPGHHSEHTVGPQTISQLSKQT